MPGANLPKLSVKTNGDDRKSKLIGIENLYDNLEAIQEKYEKSSKDDYINDSKTAKHKKKRNKKNKKKRRSTEASPQFS